MKLLITVLSIVCFSFGARANDFGNSELVMFEAQGRFVSINLCINEAASNGTLISSAYVPQEPKNKAFQSKYDGFFSVMTYLHQNRIYMIEFYVTPSDDISYLTCRVLEVKEGG